MISVVKVWYVARPLGVAKKARRYGGAVDVPGTERTCSILDTKYLERTSKPLGRPFETMLERK